LAGVFGWALGRGMGTSNEVEAGGGAINNLIALSGTDSQRIYLIDTDAKTIMVYEAPGGRSGFSMVAGRWYEADSQVLRMTRSELPYDSRQYTVQNMVRQLQQLERGRNP
jgi:hypothetical protein